MRLEEAEESFYMLPTDPVNFAPAGDPPAEHELGELPPVEGILLPGGAEVVRLQELDLFEGERRRCSHALPLEVACLTCALARQG
ncbi:hypothetical protein [Streptomyces griseoaurantiacus]|uniref:hypothetical protein n=1 Tax=Streptomyces griseoaurantiacus TaxID=68213 RepID=UPI0015A3E5E9|nr:hypothetical protein [Streptomyces jietaisiensis]